MDKAAPRADSSGTEPDSHPPESTGRIRSFANRGGRLTPGQRRNLDALWPRYGLARPDQPLDWPQVFGRDAPRTLEIGFGAGEALVALARGYPAEDFIGIEVYPPGVGRALGALAEAGLTNVRVFDIDAIDALAAGFAAACLDRVLLYFPDPWPKKRHHKRRIVQHGFADEIAHVLKPGGWWRLATDWQNYAEHMRAVLDAHPAFEQPPFSQDTGDARRLTRFEARGLRKGHSVFDMSYRRRAASLC